MITKLPQACTYMGTVNAGQHVLSTFSQAVKDGLLASIAIFPTPPILPAALQSLINTYNTALTAASALGKDNVQAKNAARFNLENALRADASYVNGIINAMNSTGTSYDDLKTLILGTGYELSKDPANAGPLSQQIIKKFRSIDSGQIRLTLTKNVNAKGYVTLYRIVTSPVSEWLLWPTSSTRPIITGLNSGSNYELAAYSVGADPTRNVSDSVFQICI